MKKYIVKFKESKKALGEYASKEEASAKLMKFINSVNKSSYIISLFDFCLEEVECKEVNEVITDFETARKFLGIKPNDEFTVVRTEHSDIEFDDVVSLVDVASLVGDINPKYIEALMALNKLFTIAEAWNKEDGFVPDFSDWNQNKWYPWLKYDKDAAGFVYAYTASAPSVANATFGFRLCFKSEERAAQFGKQFTHLYNKVFL